MAYPLPSELLPHTGHAVLVDEILEQDDAGIRVRACITPAHPFFVAGQGVPAWVGIEMMAQAVATHAGLLGRRAGRGPRQGMLLGTRRYRARVPWFAEGMALDVHAATAFGQDGGMAACDCRIEGREELLAEATIIIMEGALP